MGRAGLVSGWGDGLRLERCRVGGLARDFPASPRRGGGGLQRGGREACSSPTDPRRDNGKHKVTVAWEGQVGTVCPLTEQGKEVC